MGIHFSNSNHPELENCCRNSTTVSHLVIVSHSDTYPHSKIILNTSKSSLIHCHYPTLQNHWNPLSYILLRLSQILWSSVTDSLINCHRFTDQMSQIHWSTVPDLLINCCRIPDQLSQIHWSNIMDSLSTVTEPPTNCHRFTDKLLKNPWSTATDLLNNCHRFTDQLLHM